MLALAYFSHGLYQASTGRVASQMELVVKNPPASTGDLGDMGSIPELGRAPGGGHGNPLQYPCLENPTDRGAWQAAVQGITKSQTGPKWLSTLTQSRQLRVCPALEERLGSF